MAVVVALASMAAGCGGGGGGGGSGSGNPPPASSNKAPTITGLVTSQAIAQDELSDLLAFTVGDAESPVSDITLTATTSSSELIDQDGLQISGNGANRMLSIAPAGGASGSAIVTVTATDPSGASSTAKVNVTVSSGQRSFTEVVATAFVKSMDDEAERVSGYSLVDDTNEDPNVFDYLLE
jgi:hypothetical protein